MDKKANILAGLAIIYLAFLLLKDESLEGENIEIAENPTKGALRTGCVITFKKNYFKGTWRKPKYDGYAILKAKIKKHSYGATKGQHTFTLEVLDVLEDDSPQAHSVGDRILIKGRNLYPNVIEHEPGEESERASR
jgi:hypothetical protein